MVTLTIDIEINPFFYFKKIKRLSKDSPICGIYGKKLSSEQFQKEIDFFKSFWDRSSKVFFIANSKKSNVLLEAICNSVMNSYPDHFTNYISGGTFVLQLLAKFTKQKHWILQKFLGNNFQSVGFTARNVDLSKISWKEIEFFRNFWEGSSKVLYSKSLPKQRNPWSNSYPDHFTRKSLDRIYGWHYTYNQVGANQRDNNRDEPWISIPDEKF